MGDHRGLSSVAGHRRRIVEAFGDTPTTEGCRRRLKASPPIMAIQLVKYSPSQRARRTQSISIRCVFFLRPPSCSHPLSLSFNSSSSFSTAKQCRPSSSSPSRPCSPRTSPPRNPAKRRSPPHNPAKRRSPPSSSPSTATRHRSLRPLIPASPPWAPNRPCSLAPRSARATSPARRTTSPRAIPSRASAPPTSMTRSCLSWRRMSSLLWRRRRHSCRACIRPSRGRSRVRCWRMDRSSSRRF